MRKTYSDLVILPTFEERFLYLKLSGSVGFDTFGFDRYLNQMLYKSVDWRRLRNSIILRDEGCDLGIDDRPIFGRVMIHHINPITKRDVLDRADCVFDPENLICVSHLTHNAIHYSDESILYTEPVIRRPNDTIPWRT